MRIVVSIGHPAHVHLFKNFIREMKKRGHRIMITASDKDVTYRLLDSYGLDYIRMGPTGKSRAKKLWSLIATEARMYRAARTFQPDLFIALGSIAAAQVSKIMGRPCIIFDDDEYTYPYYSPFADAICGFSGFKKSGRKVIKIDSYKELAYLHPNWYHCGSKGQGWKDLQLDGDFALLRFVAWTAFHDVNQSGFGIEAKRKLVRELEKYLAVAITSEAALPEEFRKYQLRSEPDEIHDILCRARLLVCDSQTMATEAGVLGVPAIRCNSFVGDDDMQNFVQLEHDYGLIYNYRDSDAAIRKSVEILKDTRARSEWAGKRARLLSDKIDVTAFMVWLVENYPRSFHEMKDHPEVQSRFRKDAL